MTRLLMLPFGAVENIPGVHAVSIALSFIIVTLLTVVLSELVPKAVTLQYTLTLACLIARPILLIQTFYRFVNALAVARGIDPDAPPHLKKVTETR